jgi:hypothetical protein
LVSIVSEAVEDRVGEYGIREQGLPLLDTSVAGEDHSAPEIPFRDNLSNIVGLGLTQCLKAKVIDYEHVWLGISPDGYLPCVV